MRAALQLYSVKDETAKDFKGTLKKVAECGYFGVEFAGYGGLSAEEMKAELEKNGLVSVGTHAGFDRFENAIDEEIAYNKIIGSKYIVCPGCRYGTIEDIEYSAKVMNAAVDRAEAAGMKIGYHNHDGEFQMIDGKYKLDLLFERLDPRIIMELDVYWSTYGGVAYEPYMKSHAGRVELIHVKDMLDLETKANCTVGNGMIDFAHVKALGDQLGVKEYIVEQEELDCPLWDSVANGMKHLKTI